MMSAGDTRSIIQGLFDALAKIDWNNPEKALESLADDAEWWTAGSLPAFSGSRSKRDFAAMLGKTGCMVDGGINWTATSWIVEGDRASVEVSGYLKLKDGRNYHNQYVMLAEIRDSKIWKVREYMDTAYVKAVFGD